MMAAYRDHEDLISVGAYRRGGNRLVDAAIDMQDDINRFLRQSVEERPLPRGGLQLTSTASAAAVPTAPTSSTVWTEFGQLTRPPRWP